MIMTTIDIWNITIPQLTGDEVRRAYICLPNSYYADPQRRYPVLYMFDGQNIFFDSDATYGKSWGMKDYLDRTGADIIVAAVECNRHPDNSRLCEYSPYSFSSPIWGDVTGRGDITMDWFIDEFKPAVDENFRTLPDREHTFIGGSSMGGLMSLYAVLRHNSVFSRAAALSPSLCFNFPEITQLIENTAIASDTVIYMDCGSTEIDGEDRNFPRTAYMLMCKGAMVNSRIILGGTHSEASWEKQVPFFMSTLLYGLN